MNKNIILAIILLFSIKTENLYCFNNRIKPNSHIIIIRGVYYEFGSSKIQPEGALNLKKAGLVIKEIKNIKIKLTPYVDSIEYLKFGEKLARQRLEGVTKFLKEDGIPDSSLVIVKYPNSYLSPNNTEENRQLNRCVNMEVNE